MEDIYAPLFIGLAKIPWKGTRDEMTIVTPGRKVERTTRGLELELELEMRCGPYAAAVTRRSWIWRARVFWSGKDRVESEDDVMWSVEIEWWGGVGDWRRRRESIDWRWCRVWRGTPLPGENVDLIGPRKCNVAFTSLCVCVKTFATNQRLGSWTKLQLSVFIKFLLNKRTESKLGVSNLGNTLFYFKTIYFYLFVLVPWNINGRIYN